MITRARSERGAFTLIELMVVMTIIVALVALTASASLKFVEVQQRSNTQSTLDRVQSQLNRAWSKVKDQAIKEPIPDNIASWIQTHLAQIGPTDPNVTGRIRVIYVKLRLRQSFPMTFDEALNKIVLGSLVNSPLPPLPAYTTYLTSLGITGSRTDTTHLESSVCLLMALQRGVSGAGINPSELTAGGAAGSMPSPVNPNLGSLTYLTDAWGQPIFFSRVPAGCPLLNSNPKVPGGGQPGANDPLDPQGYLQTPNWPTTPGLTGQQYGFLFTKLTKQVLAGTNSSYKLAPMVASGGSTNWTKGGGQTPPFDPATFAPVTGSTTMFSNP